MLQGTHVTLADMLACREARAARQAALLGKYRVPLISFGLNIPGPVKTNAALRRLFDDGLSHILAALAALQLEPLALCETHADTGDECLLAVRGDAALLKEKMTAIEERHPLGRLLDIDVLDEAGQKLSRPLPRRCLLCGGQAQACARSRRHSVEELSAHIAALLKKETAAEA